MAMLGAAGLLAACGSGSDDDKSPGGETRSVSHQFGTFEVPLLAKRIVTTDYDTAAQMIVLDSRPVGATDLDLLTAEGLSSIDLPLDAAAHHALGPLFALHGHHHGCAGHVDVGVGLLLRTVTALTGHPARVGVHPDADPPLWLGLPGTEVALGTPRRLLPAVLPAPARRPSSHHRRLNRSCRSITPQRWATCWRWGCPQAAADQLRHEFTA